MSSWTPERVATITKRWTIDGWSATQIAREIGGVTRMAVIGKIHRLGLSGVGRAKPHVERFAKQPRVLRVKALPKIVAKRSALTGLIQGALAKSLPSPRPVLRCVPITQEPVGLLALNGGCKYPVSEHDGECLFCGAHRPGRGPFCQDHARISYQPSAAAKRAQDRGLERFLRRQVAL